eukprot:CAMPEP_0182425858 /NCGR_PEP_ID=MMETSP1167-20130531/12356_1 /TAXON_ID=2988 /ORGANISM="Mallomonas Sp, Strain CCMP3275" /LENGTH=170 /DNA_ID=CAMNT_0024606909 /DNA_START=82 /DNA_END=591 /DNA_ORIENTATION=+
MTPSLSFSFSVPKPVLGSRITARLHAGNIHSNVDLSVSAKQLVKEYSSQDDLQLHQTQTLSSSTIVTSGFGFNFLGFIGAVFILPIIVVAVLKSRDSESDTTVLDKNNDSDSSDFNDIVLKADAEAIDRQKQRLEEITRGVEEREKVRLAALEETEKKRVEEEERKRVEE